LDDPVVALVGERIRKRETIVEDPEAGAHHQLGARVIGAPAGRPGEPQTRGKIQGVMNIGLGLVTQYQIQRKVGTQTPVVAGENADIEAIHGGFRNTSADAELGGATAPLGDLRRF
jgi:hypothetical protein